MNVQKFKLATMFSIMFAGAFIFVSALFYYYAYTQQVKNQKEQLKQQATTVLNFADVLLESRNEKFFSGESPETPQVIQNEVFQKFTEISKGKVFFKEARPNPYDPLNQATPYEVELIQRFSKNRELKEIDDTISHKGKEYFISARPIIAEEKCKMCHPDWTAGNVVAVEDVMIDLEDYYNALNENIILTVSTGVINIIIILFLTHFLFKKYVSSRINKLLQLIFRVEKGNFVIEDLVKDEPLENENSQNEIDKLFRHTKKMVDSLKPVIANVVTASKNMAFQASYSYVKIDDTNQYAKQQSEFVHHSKEQLENVLDVNNSMVSSLDLLMNNTEESKKIVSKSKEDVDNSLKQGNETASIMDETSHSINDLKSFSEEVSKMTEIITDIADETNLIALNAAIEAAHAGEHGRGFAVVADKIRELAEISRENAQDISQVLNKINEQIKRVSSSALNSKESVLALVENSQKINTSFEKVEETFNLISTSLDSFQDEFINASKMLNSVDENLNDVEASSHLLVENAENTKEIMHTISLKSAELKTLADSFDIVLNKRGDERTVLTPPILAEDEKGNNVYIFDKSKHGISFYYKESTITLSLNDIITLTLDETIDSHKSIKCQVKYTGLQVINDINFYGAQII
ncbi:methyl-accepting chemotaxis protein [Sulfurimonas indica]|uniref:methyl-accepting chemotaxis protein n=1 Tax=Sulfurimonas indica TaxID=2508707 RepID=UPI0012656C70|nr:methyl-accepting chemotaxis protein [Sulfurimonas indica]